MNPRFRAHDVSVTRLYAVARVCGVLVVLWAVAVGLYLFFGGVSRLTNPVFGPLMQTVGGYQIVGGVLAAGGIIGVVGLIARARWLSIMSCVLCASWSGAMAAFLFIAAAHGLDNLAGWLSLFCCFIYILRFYLLVEVPCQGEMVHLR
jgi:hypothetical protein